jgi:hypothetical protein
VASDWATSFPKAYKLKFEAERRPSLSSLIDAMTRGALISSCFRSRGDHPRRSGLATIKYCRRTTPASVLSR